MSRKESKNALFYRKYAFHIEEEKDDKTVKRFLKSRDKILLNLVEKESQK